MTSSHPRGVRRAVLALALFAVSTSAAAQGWVPENASTIAVSKTASPTYHYNAPQYLADRTAGSSYSGVVNLWLRNAQGAVLGSCTGSLLTGGKILTAAHCVSSGAALTATSFTARFYEMGIGWVDVQGTEMAVKTGYLGNVVSEHDVAVLTLSSEPPSFARTYALAVGPVLGQTITLAGYGLTGDGDTGSDFDNY